MWCNGVTQAIPMKETLPFTDPMRQIFLPSVVSKQIICLTVFPSIAFSQRICAMRYRERKKVARPDPEKKSDLKLHLHYFFANGIMLLTRFLDQSWKTYAMARL